MEENNKQTIKKDGVDFLIKQGYKKLSAKTFISDVDLELFLNRDFTNINKTRALGFIQILEREYDVDLKELKDAYLKHDNATRPKKPEKLFIEEPIIEKKPWQKYLPFIAALLAALGLIYYLFRPTVETVEPLVNQLEENRSIIKKAEKNIEKLEKNESQKISDSALENSLNAKQAKNEAKTELSSLDLSSVDDLDLDKVVLQMMKDRNISSEDKEDDTNKTLKQSEQNSTKKVADADSDKAADKEATKTETNKKTEKKVTKKSNKKLDKLANIPLAKTIPIEKFNQKQGKKSKTTKKATIGKGLSISPIQKAWVGVIYLDDFSKKDFLIRKKLPLNANRDQLIVVGHNKFKIYNKTYSVKFRARGPVRFIYQDGELMEINKKEFMRTSAGVAW